MKSKNIIVSIAFCIVTVWSIGAQAATFSVESQLTGDPRVLNPSGLIVDVNIDVVDRVSTWTVDIISPSHPNIKLDAFFFNLAINAGDVVWGDFNPLSWSVAAPANNAAGSGSADFNFLADTSNPATNVTNSQSLTFTGTKTTDWLLDDFLNAGLATSSDQVLGSGQVGAHLQSLTVDNLTCPQDGCGDSGFAFGDYERDLVETPLPAAVWLFGSGLVGLIGFSRRKSTSALQA